MRIELLALIAVALGISAIAASFKRVTIFEYERGLLYQRGRYQRLLSPGQYWLYKGRSTIQTLDIRPKYVSVQGHEILSADSITLKISLVAAYEVVDPVVAINRVDNYQQAFYLLMQVGIRTVVGAVTMDEVLQGRDRISQQLLAQCAQPVSELGLRLMSVNIKDIMLPGELKRIYTQVVKAQKEGLAALERARGETAALRNLANAAKLAAENPALMQLRLIQALEQSSGHTLVLGKAVGINNDDAVGR
ncbi:MAG: slipin family protein [Cyanobacteria bacterium J06642_9]